MNNHYEEGTPAWDLFEVAEEMAQEPVTGDPAMDSAERRTIALYRVGAGLVAGLTWMSDQRDAYSIAENIGHDLSLIATAIGEVAEAIKGDGGS